MRHFILIFFALAGCASPEKPTAQVNQAVKSRYWAIQDANRERIPIPLPLRLPERFDDGALRVPSTEIILIPRSP
ncbi:MAG: hypothetical protein Q7S40_34075 [Opitutaceae bacterium]|nr:hypothetical protein [Opitutaceae bacterium]